VLDYIKNIKEPNLLQPVSAWDLFQFSSSSPSRITTFSASIDAILDGGVPLGSVTEICGAPGVGKTQLCIQLAVNALIPKVLDGVGGETSRRPQNPDDIDKTSSGPARAVILDTEGSFVAKRIFEIAAATVGHLKHLISILDERDVDEFVWAELKSMNADSFCDRVLIARCTSLEELLAAVKRLPRLFQLYNVSLVVIDSLAMHLRQEIQDLALRTRVLNGLVQDLMQLAVGTNGKCTAIVLTNQMTTKIYSAREKESHLIPALGESWGHAPQHRLLLHWDRELGSGSRLATIFKSPSRPEQTVPFDVTRSGIRDNVEQFRQNSKEAKNEMEMANKKQRT